MRKTEGCLFTYGMIMFMIILGEAAIAGLVLSGVWDLTLWLNEQWVNQIDYAGKQFLQTELGCCGMLIGKTDTNWTPAQFGEDDPEGDYECQPEGAQSSPRRRSWYRTRSFWRL